MRTMMTMMAAWCALAVALLSCASLASAEFKSKLSQGKGANYALEIEAGGATVQCDPSEAAGSTPVTWHDSGTKLTMKVSAWGSCVIKASSLKESEAKMSACEYEVKQPNSETNVLGNLPKSCTITTSECEITLPSSNGQLKTELAYTGAEGENLVVEPAVENLVTTVSSGCGKLGIAATSEGTLKAAETLEAVAMQAAKPQFSFSIGGGSLPRMGNAVGNSREIVLKNVGEPATPSSLISTQSPGGNWFEIANKTEQECRTTLLATNGTCIMKVRLLKRVLAGEPILKLIFKVGAPVRSEVRLFVAG
jgi:hypothetical protein